MCIWVNLNVYMPSFSTLFQTVSFRGYDHQSSHDGTWDNPSDHCYWELGFPNVHMKTFTHSPFFGHKVGYLLVGRVFFTAGNQNHLRSLAVLLVKQVNKKQRSLVSSCLGGIGIVVENLHVKTN